MAVRIARATRPRHATHKLVQVQGVDVNVLYLCHFVLLNFGGHLPIYHVADGITKDTTLDGGWSDFGACSKACDGGTQSRNCSNPAHANGGKNCVGDSTTACNTQTCRGTISLSESMNDGICFCCCCISPKTELSVFAQPPWRSNAPSSMHVSPILYAALQPALRRAVHWTGDGLGSVHALKLVAAGRISEYATTLRLRMAARVV